jgi:transposase
VNPDTGEDAALFLRWADTKAMNHFLTHISAALGERKCLLVMDRAGWHCSKEHVVPPNIEIVYLPPYSPELNLIECLWRWLKRDTIRNRLYLFIGEVMDFVQECQKSATPDFLKGLCRCSYL